MIDIVKLTNNYVVINKPAGVPSQSDISGDDDALAMTSRALSDLGADSSLWLVHRLDRTVGGLMVIARSAKYAALLSAIVSDGDFSKVYLAVVEGKAPGGELIDYLYKDARIGKSLIVTASRSGAKKARLCYVPIAEYSEQGKIRTLVTVRLYTGRFHQIRAQLSNSGYPIVGDKKYGSRDR